MRESECTRARLFKPYGIECTRKSVSRPDAKNQTMPEMVTAKNARNPKKVLS